MAARFLPAAAMQALAAIYQHRLVSTSQLRQMVLPGRSLRWTQQVLAELGSRSLAPRAPVQRRAPAPGGRPWLAPERGAARVEAVPARPGPRRGRRPPELAAGPPRAHALAAHDGGIAFVRAARGRGRGSGPRSCATS